MSNYGNNADMVTIKAKRKAFDLWKTTLDFEIWRVKQYRHQKGLCAWCQLPINKRFKKIHVDHALPLFHGGTNKTSNLVLAHARCNIKKWVRVDETPTWIQNSLDRDEKKQRLIAARKEQLKVIRDLIDDYINETELYWLMNERL